MEVNVQETPPDNARKRIANPEQWKVNREKRLRYSSKSMPVYPTCGHRGSKKNCTLLTMMDIRSFHSAFYTSKSKATQDAFILKYCSTSYAKRHRAKNGERGNKKLTYTYFVSNQGGNRIEVCRRSFLNILAITKHRVEGVFLRFKKGESHVPVETRGGYRKEEKYRYKIQSIVEFIKKFKGIESHYSRKNSCKTYLASDLSIAKMWRMYQESVTVELKVTQSLFRSVFVSKFNLSFKTPATDVCSTCLEFTETLKHEKDQDKKNVLETRFKLHKQTAKAFFNLLKEKKDNLFTISFDMQKNLPLPKLPDQICYYSRQLYCYNLTVVSGVSTGKDALSKANVSVYTWCEHEMKKSSNEVSSAVYNELQEKLMEGAFNDIETVRLVADGCSGQNKNSMLLAMCLLWLNRSPSNIKRLEIVFPVTGHSFMPSDRVFGLIERTINKKDTIVDLKDYHEAFKSQGTLKELGKDWKNYDWRTDTRQCIKDTKDLHFKISKVRRLVLIRAQKSNILVQGEMHYLTDTAQPLAVTKKTKRISMINPDELKVGVKVNPSKVADVKKLLEAHYGQEWHHLEELAWYRDILQGNEQQPEQPGVAYYVEDEPECECMVQEVDNIGLN